MGSSLPWHVVITILVADFDSLVPLRWQGVVRMMHDSPSQFASVDENPEDHLGGESWPRTPRSDSPLGLYTYGGVGVGKTMLMDLFVVSAPPEFRVLRTHFHDFMLDIHSRLRTHTKTADPLTFVAQDISETHRVLALDEFFVTDVADAMILHRLFNQLWDQGIVLVATSNRKPEDLYEGGLQRDLFLPFIDKLKVHCQIHNLDSPVDYRKLARHQKGLYFAGPNAKADLEQSFASMCVGCPEVQNASVTVKMGRRLAVPRARGPHCYFTFDELCGQAVGAADYIALARRFHTVCLEGIPKITGASRSDAYRLVMLVDVLYDNRIRLVCTAETQPAELFTNILTQAEHQSVDPSLGADSGEAIVDDNLGFAKDRTVSRLIEMRGLDYQVEHSNRHAPELLLALAEAQERPKE
ncbi:unnamed protein product [Ostreobium quekettii]|uniref:AFG1-like ATPase n=1 Tax=Ostreobium quekettii TaxID=121088 RepID=A0A8S1JDD2_9CHLO|nr:unnamed protein product [Ostreobium quekettii]